MKSLVVALAILLTLLSYRALFGDGSLQELSQLREQVRVARTELVRLENRNQSLKAEVDDLKNGLHAVEERARFELGMMGSDEIFYHFVRRGGSSSLNSNDVPFNGLTKDSGTASAEQILGLDGLSDTDLSDVKTPTLLLGPSPGSSDALSLQNSAASVAANGG